MKCSKTPDLLFRVSVASAASVLLLRLLFCRCIPNTPSTHIPCKEANQSDRIRYYNHSASLRIMVAFLGWVCSLELQITFTELYEFIYNYIFKCKRPLPFSTFLITPFASWIHPFFLSTAILNGGDPSSSFNQPAYKRPSRHLYFKARCLMAKRLLSSAPLRGESLKKKKRKTSLAAQHHTNGRVWLSPTWSPHTALYTLFKRTTSLRPRSLTPPVANCAQSVSFLVGVRGWGTVFVFFFCHNETLAAAEPWHNNDLSETGLIWAHKQRLTRSSTVWH